MRFTSPLRAITIFVGIFASVVFSVPAQDQTDQEQNAKEPTFKSMPPRAAAADYQAQGTAGMVNIGAEFAGHSVTAPDHTYSSEEYVVVEAGLFGPPGAHVMLTRDDFSLRVNGKKATLPSQPYELVFHSLKDPEWQPPESADAKESKSSLSTSGGGGGAGGGDKLPPIPPKMPFPLRRAMEQRVQRSAMEEGDRPLPKAGLLFFRYGGKAEGIKSLELIYNGAAGQTTLELQP